MAFGRRAATIRESVANVAADPGHNSATYVVPLDRPRLYRWSAGSVLTADGVTTLTHSGGVSGNWLEVIEDDAGAALTDAASTTITVGGEAWRTLPAATLTANRTLRLSPTNAQAGHQITVTRLDVEAYTYTIENTGPAGGTLITFPVSSRYWATFQFDGTNWNLRAAGAMAS